MKIKSNYFIALASVMTIGTAAAQNIVHVGNVTNTGTVTNTGNVTNTGTLTNVGAATVNGTLTVAPTPSDSVPTGNGNSVPATGNTDVQVAPGSPLNYKYTPVGNGGQVTESVNGGGVVAETNGNVTLNEQSASTDTVAYLRATRFQYVRPGENFDGFTQGEQIPGTQEEVAVYLDEAGNYIELGVMATPLLDPITGLPVLDGAGQPILILSNAQLAALAPATLDAITTESGTEISGGNLVVEGNSTLGNSITDTTSVSGALNVAGITSTNGIDNNNQKITGLKAGEIATDAVNKGQLDSAVLFETTRAKGIEAGLRTDLTTEVAARIAGDNQLRSDYQSADRRLRGDIDQNTRGIAMVAAMTNTKVEAGKTHGVDFNIAQFQDETGMSFGYANRINENLQIHAAAASTTDFDEAVARIGVSYQW